ncbi:MAG: ATP-binding protein [Thermoproteota archaeon]
MRLSISGDFFVQFAKRTWLSPYSVVNELVEDAYDEDATRVIVTVSGGYVVVEDDVGMDRQAVERYLVIGSTHKQSEPVSPRFRRFRTGRYGVGRMSFLAFFDALKVKTRKGDFASCFMIDEACLAALGSSGQSEVKVLDEPPLERDGSEIWLLGPRTPVSAERMLESLKELPILREPFFEVWLRAGDFKPWSLEGAVKVKPREIMGERIPFVLEDGVQGEITIAYRPLSEKERGILILHGGHAVTRSNFGLPQSELSRITGYVRCNWITVRFADKAAVVEDEAYERLQKIVRDFLVENVLPKAAQVEMGMTYEEGRIFAEVDRLRSGVIAAIERGGLVEGPVEAPVEAQPPTPLRQPEPGPAPPPSAPPAPQACAGEAPWSLGGACAGGAPEEARPDRPSPGTEAPAHALHPLRPARPAARRPAPLKREVALPMLGFRAVPYDDADDEREFFVDGNVIYVNRGHPAYRKELKMGREVLKRHVLRIVASALAQNAYPESEALEYANRLIAGALAKL